MPGDHSKKFDDDVKECEVCGDLEHEPSGHPYIPHVDESVLSIAGIRELDNPLAIGGIREHHNPLDIPFGKEQEINMNVKDKPDETDEGGLGSGRNPEGGGSSGSSQQGPLISFGMETVKELMDAKIRESCPCRKKN